MAVILFIIQWYNFYALGSVSCYSRAFSLSVPNVKAYYSEETIQDIKMKLWEYVEPNQYFVRFNWNGGKKIVQLSLMRSISFCRSLIMSEFLTELLSLCEHSQIHVWLVQKFASSGIMTAHQNFLHVFLRTFQQLLVKQETSEQAHALERACAKFFLLLKLVPLESGKYFYYISILYCLHTWLLICQLFLRGFE